MKRKCCRCLRFFEEEHEFNSCNCCREKNKKYRESHKEELKQKRKLYKQKNIEKIKIKKHLYYENNKAEILNKDKERRIKNKYNYILKKTKSNAKNLGLEFDLDVEYIEKIWPKNNICYLLEKEMVYGGLYAPSADRIDSKKGYIKGNIQIISYRANTIKNDATIEELKKVHDYMLKINKTPNLILELNKKENIDKNNYLQKKLHRKKAYCKKNNIIFDLNCKELIVPKRCPVLGIELTITNSKMLDNSPSLDRLDPNGHYVKNNVVIMSTKANRIKSNANIYELNKILNNWITKIT